MGAMPRGTAMTWLAEQDADRVALVCGEDSITRGGLERLANRLARGYAALGVGADDLVAIVLPNGIEFVAATIAVWKLGATPLPVSWRLPDAELHAIVDLASPALVVGVDADRAHGHRSVPAGYSPPPDATDEPLPPRAAAYGRALTSGGSTGRPKIIVSHEPAVIDPEETMLGAPPNGVHLVPGPLFHNAPFTMATNGVLHGATVVMMTRFDPAEALELIERHRVDFVQVVPTMLHRIWRLDAAERASRDLSSLEVVFSTGGAFPAWLKEAWGDWIGDDKIVEIYGSSESYGSTIVTGAEARRKPGTVGRPRFGPPRVLDPDDPTGPPLGVGEVGLIAFERPAAPNYHYLGAEPTVYAGSETLSDLV
jgi:bile acid-coenzyme A ligase